MSCKIFRASTRFERCSDIFRFGGRCSLCPDCDQTIDVYSSVHIVPRLIYEVETATEEVADDQHQIALDLWRDVTSDRSMVAGLISVGGQYSVVTLDLLANKVMLLSVGASCTEVYLKTVSPVFDTLI